MRGRLMAVAVVVLALVAPLAARAAGYPAYTDAWAHDFAEVIDPDDEAAITGMLQGLARETGVDVAAVTVGALSDYQPGADLETFATGLFNHWALGDAGVDDGVLLLVAVDDRQARVTIGDGFDDSYVARSAEVIDVMLPYFRDGAYSDGVLAGARRITETFRSLVAGGAPAAVDSQGNPVDAPGPARGGAAPGVAAPESLASDGRSPDGDGGSRDGDGALWAGVGGGAALTGGAGVLSGLRLRPRKCPKCDKKMARLAEGAAEEQFLDDGQAAEERVSSVEYAVFQCATCSTSKIERRGKLFSGHHRCGSCGYKTLARHRQTLEHATYTSGGRDLVTEDCRHCGRHNEREVRTARKVAASSSGARSSSSSSRSGPSGGGRSSGRGSSGSW